MGPLLTAAEKRYHLMDGLLYPAVVGAGLMVLLTHIVVARTDPEFAGRIALGGATVVIYCASYAAFKDVPDALYGWRLCGLDLLEVALIFWCFGALGLLEATDREPASYGWFAGVLGADILFVQVLWRYAAFGTWDLARKHFGLRLGIVGLFVVAALADHFVKGGDVRDTNWIRIGTAVVITCLVLWYEFRLRIVSATSVHQSARD